MNCDTGQWVCDGQCCTWGTEIVDAQGHAGPQSWIAVSDAGDINIAYRVEDENDDTIAGSRRAQGTFGSWTTVDLGVLSPRAGYGVRLALVDGKPWVSEYDGTEYVDGTDDVVVWSPSGASTTVGQLSMYQDDDARTHLAVDSTGKLRLCRPTELGSIACDTGNGTSFATTTTFDVPANYYTAEAISSPHQAFALDADDHWRGAFLTAGYDAGMLAPLPGLFYAEDGGTPELVQDDTLYARWPALVVQADGTPHLAFVDDTQYDAVLTYATRSGAGEWSLDTLSKGAGAPSIDLDPDGRVTIAYYDVNATTLQLSTLEDSGWTTETVDASPRAGVNPCLTFGPDGYPHISYYDDTIHALKHATWVVAP